MKNVNLLRDPYSNLSTNLAYVEFYSVEHAQYALTSYRDATRGTHGGRGRDAPASAAFAETKSMLRLQREVCTDHRYDVDCGFSLTAIIFCSHRRPNRAALWHPTRW